MANAAEVAQADHAPGAFGELTRAANHRATIATMGARANQRSKRWRNSRHNSGQPKISGWRRSRGVTGMDMPVCRSTFHTA